jgi:RNA polymerase sigma-70 factor (ECF subfamily)
MDALVTQSLETPVGIDQTLEREFEEHLADTNTLVFRVALGVLHNREDAEETAQEVFIRAYRRYSRLREPGRFRAWIVRIAFRLALDRARTTSRRVRRELAASDPAPPPPTVEDLAASRELGQRVRHAVDSLPTKLRMAVVLAAIEGHAVSDVARLLRVPEGTVKSRLFKARKILTEKLR